MKHLIVLIPIFLFKLSFAQTNDYNIKAKIDGVGNDTIYIMYYPLSNIDSIKRDTLTAKDNFFTYQLKINEHAGLAILPQKSFYKRIRGGLYMPQTKFIELFVSPGDKIQINGSLSKYYLEYTMKGSLINEEIARYRETYKTPAIEAVKIELQIDSLQAIQDKKKEVAELFDRRSKQFNEISKAKLQFINQHLNNDLSAYYLSRLPLETFAEYYPKLTNTVRNGRFSAVLKHTYQNYLNLTAANKAEKELIEGKLAPDFSLKGIDGKLISLAEFKGKFIVLDFWGTWCGPCMQELPKLKSFYEKYKSQIELVGIACNDNADGWINAINKNQLSWTQLINADDNDVSVLYGVKAFPTKIILDKDLKFIKRYVGTDEDFYKTLIEIIK